MLRGPFVWALSFKKETSACSQDAALVPRVRQPLHAPLAVGLGGVAVEVVNHDSQQLRRRRNNSAQYKSLFERPFLNMTKPGQWCVFLGRPSIDVTGHQTAERTGFQTLTPRQFHPK